MAGLPLPRRVAMRSYDFLLYFAPRSKLEDDCRPQRYRSARRFDAQTHRTRFHWSLFVDRAASSARDARQRHALPSHSLAQATPIASAVVRPKRCASQHSQPVADPLKKKAEPGKLRRDGSSSAKFVACARAGLCEVARQLEQSVDAPEVREEFMETMRTVEQILDVFERNRGGQVGHTSTSASTYRAVVLQFLEGLVNRS